MHLVLMPYKHEDDEHQHLNYLLYDDEVVDEFDDAVDDEDDDEVQLFIALDILWNEIAYTLIYEIDEYIYDADCVILQHEQIDTIQIFEVYMLCDEVDDDDVIVQQHFAEGRDVTDETDEVHLDEHTHIRGDADYNDLIDECRGVV